MKKKNYIGSEKHKQNAIAASKKGLQKLKQLKINRIEEYNLNPKLCLSCKKPIPYEKKNENKYCNSKCRAIQINPTKGKIRTEEEKNKISNSLSGRTLTIEHKQNISNTLFSFWNDEKNKKEKTHKNKLSKEELSKKISDGIKKYYEKNPDARKRVSEQIKNRIVSDETRKKISNNVKKRIANGTHKGWEKRNKPSFPELFFMKVLQNNKIEYEFEKKEGKYFIDFAIISKKIALEIDGKQHELTERAQKDKKKTNI